MEKKRIIELAVMLSKNKHKEALRVITNYANNLKRLDAKQLDQNSTDLIKIYNLLGAVRSNTNLFPELDDMAAKTSQVVKPYLSHDKNLVTQDSITGKVISKTDISFVIDSSGKKYNVRNVNNADFVDVNSKKVDQTISDIKIGDQLVITPIAAQVYLPTDKTDGNLSADKIMVIKNGN